MITLCYSAKGGSGTTTIACIRAVTSPGPTLIVDLAGDAPAALGVSEPDRPGVLDWIGSHAPKSHLDDLVIDVAHETHLLASRDRNGAAIPNRTLTDAADTDPEQRWSELVDWFVEWGHDTGGAVIVDVGTTEPPQAFVERCPARWLVTRACYLSVRRATRHPISPTGIVLVEEPGRSLQARDVETSLRTPVVATVPWDMRVARSIDAGILDTHRIPRSVQRSLSRIAA